MRNGQGIVIGALVLVLMFFITSKLESIIDRTTAEGSARVTFELNKAGLTSVLTEVPEKSIPEEESEGASVPAPALVTPPTKSAEFPLALGSYTWGNTDESSLFITNDAHVSVFEIDPDVGQVCVAEGKQVGDKIYLEFYSLPEEKGGAANVQGSMELQVVGGGDTLVGHYKPYDGGEREHVTLIRALKAAL